jgi:hypothetical protein
MNDPLDYPFIRTMATTEVFRDPQVDRIRELEERERRLQAVAEYAMAENERLTAELADLRSSYACFVEITLGMAEEEAKQ